MPLNAGSVTIAPDGTVSGSGLALALYATEGEAMPNGAALLNGPIASYLATLTYMPPARSIQPGSPPR